MVILPPALASIAFSGIIILFAASQVTPCVAAVEFLGVEDPIHEYDTRKPQDRFSRLRESVIAGKVQLDTSGELPFLRSLLDALEIPVSSQLLVYTATSLQKNLISPRRPRALYFRDDTYVGFVPGGRVEIVSLDPELGGIFYIFGRPRPGVIPASERSDDCMNCHSPRHMEGVPGLVVESVVPGLTGGGERAFRRERTGHDIPLELRFGGWHVTGAGETFPKHWGNLMIRRSPAGVEEIPLKLGGLFDLNLYPVPTSDLLAHLLHEHQVGFVNRALQASYRYRTLKHGQKSELPTATLDALAQPIVRYLLFADEVALPPGSVNPDSAFRAAFLQAAKRDAKGNSLRDLDGQTRLLRHRCSYMIYSPAFTGLPTPLKQQVLRGLDQALKPQGGSPDFAYLPVQEKLAIRAILAGTLSP